MFETKRSSFKKLFKEIDKAYSDKQQAINQKRFLLNHLEDIALKGDNKKDLDLFNEFSQQFNDEEKEHQIAIGVRPDFRGK